MKANRGKPKGSGSRGSRKAPPTNAFQPGNTIGAAGRPKDDPELIEAFRERTPKALAVLDRVLDGFLLGVHEAADGTIVKPPLTKDAVAASVVVLDRGWGKAPTTIKLAGHDGGPVKGEVTHKALAPPDPKRFANIARVLEEAGVFQLAQFEADKTAAAAPAQNEDDE